MSSPSVPSAKGVTADALQAYIKYLPQLFNVTNAGSVPTAQAGLEAAQATSPGYAQLQLDQLDKYALPFAKIGQQVDASNAEAGAAANAALMRGAGGDAVAAAQALTEKYNPEIAAARTQTTNLLNSINLNGLSGSERAEVERSLNRSNTATGNLGVDNATNAVSNAMNFGSALQSKRSALAEALNTATNVINSTGANSFNPVALALKGQPTTVNTGTSSFTPALQPSNQASQFGASALGNITGLMGQANQSQIQGNWLGSSANVATGVLGATICCFIFLQSYNGQLPWWVRRSRDFYYNQNPRLAKGYTRMSRLLVPLMRKSKVISRLVNRFLVLPLTRYGGCVHQVEGYADGHKYNKYRKFWFSVWNIIAI